MRNLLALFRTANAKRDNPGPLYGSELVEFVRHCTEPAEIDRAMRLSTGGVFWPQTPDLRAFYEEAEKDPVLATRLHEAGKLSAELRRAALRQTRPAPKRIAWLILTDDGTDSITMLRADKLDHAMISDLHAQPSMPVPVLTARDDHELIMRGWGDVFDVSFHTAPMTKMIAANLKRLDHARSFKTAEVFRDHSLAGPAAVALFGVLARMVGQHKGNAGLRACWYEAEESRNVPRILAETGLTRADLQQAYEHLTRGPVGEALDIAPLQDSKLAAPKASI